VVVHPFAFGSAQDKVFGYPFTAFRVSAQDEGYLFKFLEG